MCSIEWSQWSAQTAQAILRPAGSSGLGRPTSIASFAAMAMLRVHPLHLLDMHTWPESVVSLIRTFLEESDMVRLNAASLVQQESRLSRPGTRYSRTTGLQTPNFKPKTETVLRNLKRNARPAGCGPQFRTPPQSLRSSFRTAPLRQRTQAPDTSTTTRIWEASSTQKHRRGARRV